MALQQWLWLVTWEWGKDEVFSPHTHVLTELHLDPQRLAC